MSHALSSRTTATEIKGLKHDAADAAMFYVGKEKPWHGLGVSVESALTSEEALKAAGLDWEVQLAPVFDADMREIKNYQRTYRTDNGNTLGIVGNRYTVIDNKSGFEILDSIIGKGANFDTAGALFGGEVVFINALMPNALRIAGDEIMPYFLLKMAHDGTGSLVLKRTPIRTVCQNTLNLAIGNPKSKQDMRMQKIKHTRNYDERVREAAQLMQLNSEYYKEFEVVANKLVAVKFSNDDFKGLLDELYPLPEDGTKRALGIADRERTKLLDAHMADDLNNIRFTAWGAYNAVADYSDHMRESRGDNKEANAFIRTFEATAMKDKALELLLARS